MNSIQLVSDWATKWMSEHRPDNVTYHRDGVTKYVSAWLIYRDPVDPMVFPISHALINHFHASDQEPFWPQHNHCAHSVSLCIDGQMTEEVMPDPTKPRETYLKVIKKGDLVFRDLNYWHRLPVGNQEEATTIFLTGEVVNPRNQVLCPDDSLLEIMKYREYNNTCNPGTN